jgi:hypothetical protein
VGKRLLCLVLLLAGLSLWTARPPVPAERPGRPTLPTLPLPERRAVAFLTREVPRWSVENRCFSCHNNGDASA